LTSALINISAYFLAVSTLVVAWIGSMLGSLKFDFRIQPSAVVLSVIESAQSPLLRRPSMMSIHGVITAAKNSSKLFDARNCRSSGILNRQANPWSLYPPKPAGQESE
jgi:hypothetical protein